MSHFEYDIYHIILSEYKSYNKQSKILYSDFISKNESEYKY